MTRIEGISADPSQSLTVSLPDGSSFGIALTYVEQQTGWFLSLTYQSFTLAAMRVTGSQNLLSQFRNVLPFGLTCIVTGDREPLFIQDFASGNAALCVLDEAELAALDAFLAS